MQHLETMKSLNNPYGQAMALANMAQTYEYMANLSKACECLETVSVLGIERGEGLGMLHTIESKHIHGNW